MEKGRYFNIGKLKCLLIFLYIFLVCLNQYIKFMGIPVFIFVLFFYVFVKIITNHFIIRNRVGKISVRYQWQMLYHVIWIIYGLIFAVVVNNESGWRGILYITINTLGYYTVFAECLDRKDIQKACYWGFLAGIICNLAVAFWEIKSGNHIMPLTALYARRFAYKPLGFYVNANDLGTILIFVIMAMLVYLLHAHVNKKYLWMGIPCITTGIYIVIQTGSLISFCVVICLPVFSFLYYKAKHKRANAYFAVIGLVLTAIIVCFTFGFEQSILRILLSFDTSTITNRLDVWIPVWNRMTDTFLTGIGPMQNTKIGVGSVHNLALEIASEYGVLIGLLFIIQYLSIMSRLFKNTTTIVNCLVVSLGLLFIPITICSSTMTKLFVIWPSVGYMLAIAERENAGF